MSRQCCLIFIRFSEEVSRQIYFGAIRIRNDFFWIRILNIDLRMQMLVRIQENYSGTSGS
jgi:hypothetical protein